MSSVFSLSRLFIAISSSILFIISFSISIIVISPSSLPFFSVVIYIYTLNIYIYILIYINTISCNLRNSSLLFLIMSASCSSLSWSSWRRDWYSFGISESKYWPRVSMFSLLSSPSFWISPAMSRAFSSRLLNILISVSFLTYVYLLLIRIRIYNGFFLQESFDIFF